MYVKIIDFYEKKIILISNKALLIQSFTICLICNDI